MKVEQRFILREWHESMVEFEEQMDALNALTGCTPESPLSSAAYRMAAQSIRALDAAYNIGGWLDWWWLECGLGANPMKAKLPNEDERLISSIEDLIQLLADEMAIST